MVNATKRKRRFGDRYDGYRVKAQDPLFHVIPHIMRSRLDSQVFFEEKIDITRLNNFIATHKKEIPNLSIYHIFVAALIRTIVQRPRLNRFVIGRRVYARNYLRVSLAVKKSMSVDADEAVIMPEFEPTDTLFEVAKKLNEAVKEVKAEEGESNGTEITVKLINVLPNFVRRFVVWLVRNLDSVGKMPKIINRISPFHSSVFVTNVGSIGLNSIYHHLYEFGTTSMFFSVGKKEIVRELNPDGTVKSKSVINIRFVLDERICDGYYFSVAIKKFKQLMKKPELLLEAPEYISEDI